MCTRRPDTVLISSEDSQPLSGGRGGGGSTGGVSPAPDARSQKAYSSRRAAARRGPRRTLLRLPSAVPRVSLTVHGSTHATRASASGSGTLSSLAAADRVASPRWQVGSQCRLLRRALLRQSRFLRCPLLRQSRLLCCLLLRQRRLLRPQLRGGWCALLLSDAPPAALPASPSTARAESNHREDLGHHARRLPLHHRLDVGWQVRQQPLVVGREGDHGERQLVLPVRSGAR